LRFLIGNQRSAVFSLVAANFDAPSVPGRVDANLIADAADDAD
jgi:hypothetical protein